MANKASTSYFIEIPEKLTFEFTKLISELDSLLEQVRILKAAFPSKRVHKAFEYMQELAKSNKNPSVDAISRLHTLIDEDGKLRAIIDSPWSDDNIAIRGYHPAPAENLEEILNAYVGFYCLNRVSDHPLLKAGGAYLNFELIHPFRDGNGRVGRLIAAFFEVEDVAWFELGDLVQGELESSHFYGEGEGDRFCWEGFFLSFDVVVGFFVLHGVFLLRDSIFENFCLFSFDPDVE